ncbi:MAG: hypothetical protein RL323_1833 [Pseudomonadota bacterium]
MQLNKEASEIFADYTLSRIPPDVRAGFAPEQIAEIRKALVAQTSMSGKVFDLRFTVPLFFRKYYFVLMVGRDRRRSTYEREHDRIEGTPKPIRSFLMATVASVVFFSFGLLVLTGLYMLKSALGIDIFPDFHLRDLVSGFVLGIDPVR